MKTLCRYALAALALAGCPRFQRNPVLIVEDSGRPLDVAIDAGCRGEAPRCVQRTTTGVCGDSGVLGRCVGGQWACPSGLVDSATCACAGMASDLSCLRRNENGSCSENGELEVCTASGWECPNGSIPRAQCTCVGSACSTCPAGFEEARRRDVNCYALDDIGRCDFSRVFHNSSVTCRGIVLITCPPGFAAPSSTHISPVCSNRPSEDAGVSDGPFEQ